MLLAGVLFDVGVVLTAGAMNITMLLCGRVLLGIAVAFASVSVTLYNSEMAPAHLRGRLNQIFQVCISPSYSSPRLTLTSTCHVSSSELLIAPAWRSQLKCCMPSLVQKGKTCSQT